MIEDRLQHQLSMTTAKELASLQGIYNAIKDGTAKVEDFFRSLEKPAKSDALADQLRAKGELEPAVTQQRQEPQQEQRQQAPEVITVHDLLRRIEEAETPAALKAIDAAARKAVEQQQIEAYEHDQIIVMLQEAKRRIGK